MHWLKRKAGFVHLFSISIVLLCLLYGWGLGLSRDFETLELAAVAAWALIVGTWVELALRLLPPVRPKGPNQNDAR